MAIAAEVDATGNVVKEFEYASHANVPDWMRANGIVYRLVTDQLGSVRLVIDAVGNVAQRLDYDAYGRVIQNTNPGFQPFGYAGGLIDNAVGLTRFSARDYDSDVGRWTSEDPLLFDGGANRFQYGSGDPINRVDITGELDIPTWLVDGVAGFGDVASFGLTALIRDIIGANEIVNFCSRAYFAGAVTGAISAFIIYHNGAELRIGRNFRFAPYGNRTGNPYGELPHYHRRGPRDPLTGEAPYGEGMRRHRPWEPQAQGLPWWRRF